MSSRQVPFVGLIHSCNDHASDGRPRDEVLGPVRARVHARFAKGRGDHTRSPFFDAQSGELTVAPRVLSEDELCAVETARDAT